MLMNIYLFVGNNTMFGLQLQAFRNIFTSVVTVCNPEKKCCSFWYMGCQIWEFIYSPILHWVYNGTWRLYTPLTQGSINRNVFLRSLTALWLSHCEMMAVPWTHYWEMSSRDSVISQAHAGFNESQMDHGQQSSKSLNSRTEDWYLPWICKYQ